MPKPRKKPGSRNFEKRLLILCEGAEGKSEFCYYDGFIKSNKFFPSVEVKIIGTKKNTGKELVNEAAKLREFKGDSVWVAYDMDGYTKHAETFNNAKGKGVKIAFSAIAFEFWILLHFRYTTKQFAKCDEVISELRRNNSFDCDKSREDIFETLKDRMDAAITNAEKLIKHNESAYATDTPVYDMNPYTNIHELLKEIMALRSQI